MFNAVYMMGGLGLFVGIGLALASKVFYVYVNPKVAAIDDILPGANCGGCGLPGCFANAEAIVLGKSEPNSCVAAGDDVTLAIASVMGVSVEAKEADIATSGCYYGLDESDIKFIYNGLNDCRAAALLGGGMKTCTIGCLGLGTCLSHCPFNAIKMGPNGLPVIDSLKCTGCGTCERVCPKNIIKLSSVTRRILKEYTTSDCTAPCQRACPAGINIREYIRLISIGDYSSAVNIIKERNPFPTIIGRICPRPCENQCRRKYVDDPVGINYLKRFAADYEFKSGNRVLPYKAPNTGRKIAIVGGGVHGLSAAFFSARLGHEPTVFETSDKLGGLLNQAISTHRLPDEILKWDIDGISDMGVKFEMCKTVGSDITISDLLLDNFCSVFTASGGWDSSRFRYSSSYVKSAIPGSYLLIDFIKNKFLNKPITGSTILCIGGEILLDELLNQCKNLDIKKVVLLPLDSSNKEDFLLKNYSKDIEVQIAKGMVLTKLLGQGEDLTKVELTNVQTGNIETLKLHTILFSAGRFPEMIFSKLVNDDINLNEERTNYVNDSWIGVPINKRPDFSDKLGIFSTGDEMSDFDSAIIAIAAGRRAAVHIHNSLYNSVTFHNNDLIRNDSYIQNVDNIDNVSKFPRTLMPTFELQDLNNKFCEIEKGFNTKEATLEASRCLQCGLICYKRSIDKSNDKTCALAANIG